MIRVIDGRMKHNHLKDIADMHKIRKKIFHDRRGWEVPVISDWEIDGYDALSP